MCQICNQCGIEYVKTSPLKGKKCNRCYSINKTFISRYREGAYSRDTLTNSCRIVLETYKLIVDNNFKGTLTNSTIPTKAKICLIDLGYYKEYANDINKLVPNSSAPKALDTLQEYKNLYSTDTNSETL